MMKRRGNVFQASLLRATFRATWLCLTAISLLGVRLPGTSVDLTLPAAAQDAPGSAASPPASGSFLPPDAQGLDFLNQLGGGSALPAGDPVEFSAKFEVEQGRGEGRLHVTAKLADDWHIYSLTQPEGGPVRSKLRVEPSERYEVAGSFTPDKPPTVHPPDIFPVPVEDHAEQVTWTAPLRFPEGVDVESLTIDVEFNGQICQTSGSCIPIDNKQIEAQFAGFYEGATQVGEFRTADSHIALRGYVEPQAVAPGGTVRVKITAVPDEGWHVYALGERDEGKISKPTLISIRQPLPAARVEASSEPMKKETGLPEEPTIFYHEEPVTWTVEVPIPEDAEPGAFTLEGIIGYQVCSQRSCDPMTAAVFTAPIEVGAGGGSEQVALSFRPEKYAVAADLAERGVTGGEATGSQPAAFQGMPIILILGVAFLAGLILNVMPCVLPVIGLKIMSFVQQAGEHRLRVLWLNVWFSLGLLSVFWALATLSVVLGVLGQEKIGWGEQFAYPTFSIPLMSVVFVFALSFLGVWEVPIPGFVGSSQAAHKMAEKEGAGGAFTKGILATLLATPCTGPMLGPLIGWAVVQPIWLTYLAFTFVGIGMAFPYLAIGAFPRLINMLPKPGAWMETFKQLMGFLLVGTVVWIFSFLDKTYTVAALSLLVALGFACWMIGRLPLTASRGAKVKAWIIGLSAVFLVGLVAFVEGRYVVPIAAGIAGLELAVLAVQSIPEGAALSRKVASWVAAAASLLLALAIAAFSLQSADLAWEPFSRIALREHLEQGRTVMVDFTADW